MLMAAKADADAAKAMEYKAGAEATARKQESQAGQASASGFAAMADFRNLRALSSGIVSDRLVAPGTSVMPGQAILRLKVVSRIRVQAELPQSSSDSAVEGGKVQVEINKKIRFGTITAVFPSINDTTRTFKVEAILENSDDTLKSGSFARMAILTDEKETDLVVRNQAIQDDLQGGHYVWLVKDNGDTNGVHDWTCTMHPQISRPGPGLCPICKMDLVPRSRSGKFVAAKQTVTIGKTDGSHTQILDGLTEGDQVVWAGFETLQPGTPIKPADWGETGPVSLPTGNGDMPGMHGMSTEQLDHSQHSSGPTTSIPPGQHETQVWTCTMHPQIVRSQPGKCPICKMALVPKEPAK
jgi:membrane fusion protein (multidrug efflux system)